MLTMLSGHCHRETTNPDDAAVAHSMCHGIYARQGGGYYQCPCPRHEGEHRCRICRYDHRDDLYGYDYASRRCADYDACTRRVNPASQTMREQIATAKAAKRDGRPGRSCECDCGGTTRGGRFMPGHDAKLKSVLLRRAAGGDTGAGDELRQRGWEK